MPVENSIRYQVDTKDGASEWEALSPGKGMVHLGESRQPFSIAMFHQLRCLDTLRAGMARTAHPFNETGPAVTELTGHCLNYMRQMLMCGADTTVDVIFDRAVHPDRFTCNNWEAVYEAVRNNQS